MWNRIFTGFVTVFTVLVIVGCSSVKVADRFNGQNKKMLANIVSSNYGWYFASCVPIITGDSNDQNSWHVFQESVTVDSAYKALMEKSNQLGANTTINVRSEEKWSADPFTGFLLWNKTVEVTGDALK